MNAKIGRDVFGLGRPGLCGQCLSWNLADFSGESNSLQVTGKTKAQIEIQSKNSSANVWFFSKQLYMFCFEKSS